MLDLENITNKTTENTIKNGDRFQMIRTELKK